MSAVRILLGQISYIVSSAKYTPRAGCFCGYSVFSLLCSLLRLTDGFSEYISGEYITNMLELSYLINYI